MTQENILTKPLATSVEGNSVLRNTYWLLSLTLLFSAATATISVLANVTFMNPIMMIIGMYGLMFLTQALSNSPWGLVSIFAFTGFMGYTLAPILTIYLHEFTNGGELIATSLGSTGLIFMALSAYVLTTRKDFTFMGGFLFVAVMVAFLAGIGSLFFHMPMLNLIVSGAFALISSGFILFETSAIIQGGQRNYILATISLFVSFFNLFISLLRIFAAFAGNRR